jgi:hypothetical protein
MDNRIKNISLKEDSSTDNKQLICIINDGRRVIFEFTWELLSEEDFQGLRRESSADEFYKAIEKFLIRELDNNSLQDRYQINTHNFRDFCL